MPIYGLSLGVKEIAVNQNSSNIFQINLSRISPWITLILIIWLLGSVGLGWLVNSLLILVGFIIISPVVAFFGARWWLNRNLIQDECPVCHYEIAALNQTQLQCPSCGEPLKAQLGHLERLTPPGTIDVQAVEVSAKQLEDS